ncbi:ATPase [Sphingomonas sp. Leaf412]|uniref:F0F1 ATP synthase subunit B family protein n=1 Tax=Sphingomonas sp. Leaf412 TaxID=1736370 RepID=UPI0006FC7EBC|nr:ATPase [Sphingomonas sp. Leaf412]KQT32547.1 ATPase [Sphingomonas sp. Leaf412]
MPQISQLAATWASQIFWLLLTFGAVFFIVGRGMLPKVQATIDGRDKSIADDLSAASRARDAADAAEADWRARDVAAREKAQGLVAEARQTAALATERTLNAANAGQSAKVAEAEARIRDASARAAEEIEAVAAEAAQAIVARVAGTDVSLDDARGAVKAVIHG